MDTGEEVADGFIVTGGDGAELIKFCEEVLDQVACFIEVEVIGPDDFPACFGRDDDDLVLVGQHGDDAVIGIEHLLRTINAGTKYLVRQNPVPRSPLPPGLCDCVRQGQEPACESTQACR